METDEYKISISREIAICRRMITALVEKLHKQMQSFEYDGSFCEVFLEDLAIPEKVKRKWQEENEALSRWEERLKEYKQALVAVRVSSNRTYPDDCNTINGFLG